MSYGRGGGSSYRGSSFRGSSRGSSDTWRGRGGYTSSFQSRTYSSSSPTYDRSSSRTVYFPDSGSDRFSRSDVNDSFRRSYREESPSKRDSLRTNTSELSRKRLRDDLTYIRAPSRRSPERSFSSNDFGGRYSGGYTGGSIDKSGYSGSRGGGDYDTRDNFSSPSSSFRKPIFGSSRPPRSRGRSSRGLRSRGSRILASRRSALTDSIRKRYSSSKSSVFSSRLKGIRRKREAAESSEEDEKISEKSIKDELDEIDDEGEDGEVQEGTDEEEMEKIVLKVDNSADKREDEKEESNATKKDEEELDIELKEDTSKKAIVKKSLTPTKKPAKRKKTDSDSKKKDDNEDSDNCSLKDILGSEYVKLKCPHCSFKCGTFREYETHLRMKKHTTAMTSIALRLRAKLKTIRTEQRKNQLLLDDKTATDKPRLRLRTFFCSTCKLNYKTLKSDHQASTYHRKIREHLLPYCKVCRIQFKTPMTYEHHVCEIQHLKRKSKQDRIRERRLNADDSGTEVDPNSFMVLDAVGSGEDASDNDEEKEIKKDEEKEKIEEKSEEIAEVEKPEVKKKEITLVGADHIRKVEALYCDLCLMYLSRSKDDLKTQTLHCRSKMHLQRYIKYRDEKKRKAAAKLRAKEKAAKEVAKKNDEEPEKSEKNENEKTEDEKNESAENKANGEMMECNIEMKQERTDDDKPEENNDPVKATDTPKRRLLKRAVKSTKKTNSDEEKVNESENAAWKEVDEDLTSLINRDDEMVSDDDDRSEIERYNRFDKTSNGVEVIPEAKRRKMISDKPETTTKT